MMLTSHWVINQYKINQHGSKIHKKHFFLEFHSEHITAPFYHEFKDLFSLNSTLIRVFFTLSHNEMKRVTVKIFLCLVFSLLMMTSGKQDM